MEGLPGPGEEAVSEMKLRIVSTGKEIETNSEDVEGVMRELGKSPVSHVVKLNGKLCVEAEEVHDGDELEFIDILSGG